jgi:hypothetical protein
VPSASNRTPFGSVRCGADDLTVEVVRARWSTRSFLLYAGGLTCFVAFSAWVGYLSITTGSGGRAGWTLLLVALLALLALALRARDERVAAGVLAFAAVGAFAVFLAVLFEWFGWSAGDNLFSGFRAAPILLELLWLVAALVALSVFRFPLIVVHAVLAAWLLVTDVLSNGGWWTTTVTLAVGLAYLAAAFAVDDTYALWLHVAAGALIVLAAVGYILFADAIRRSSWAVLGYVGLFFAAVHYSLDWLHVQFLFFSGGHGARGWVPPTVFSLLGLLVVVLGLRSRAGPQVDEQLA